MKTSVASVLVGSAVMLLLLGVVAAPASAQPVPVTRCGTTLQAQNSYILTADLNISQGVTAQNACLTFNGNGISLNMNGHSMAGFTGAAFGIFGTGNNNAISGPGIIHDFDSCVELGGNHQLAQNILVYNCQTVGIHLGNFSKCVECRVHDVRSSEGTGVGIVIGTQSAANSAFPGLLSSFNGLGGCLLESSIVRSSDWGAIVARDCKVWDLVVDSVVGTGLKVGRGTSVARTVISHYHDGPGLDYTDCVGPDPANLTANGCQDSSNSVTLQTGIPLPGACPASAISINPGGLLVANGPGTVTTDCATNCSGNKFPGLPAPGNCSL
jgi:hypothetical protein